MRLSRLFSAGAILALGGCTHIIPAQIAWHCIESIEIGGVTASTTRTLDSRGQQISVRSGWLRPYQLNPRSMFQGEWLGKSSDPDPAKGRITMQLVAPGAAGGRFELRSGGAHLQATDPRLANAWHHDGMVLPWPLVQELLATGRPLFIVALDRGGAMVGAEPIDPQMIIRGNSAAEATQRLSRTMAAEFRNRCRKNQDIVLT